MLMKFLSLFISIQVMLAPNAAAALDWENNSELTHAPLAPPNVCILPDCPRSGEYELALEKEFWRHVQQSDIQGMKIWVKKAKLYVVHPSHEEEPARDGRLMMLLAGGHTMIFNSYDLHKLLPAANDGLKGYIVSAFTGLLANLNNAPALLHLADSIIWAIRANQRIPEHQNAQTFLLGIGAFAQAALPDIFGISGKPALSKTFYGPSCEDLAPWLRKLSGDICYENGLMGPRIDSFKDCRDEASCLKVGAGTEGLFAGALTLILMKDRELIQRGLTMLGDGPGPRQVALCESYFCRFNKPNDPEHSVPESTSIAPFKRVSALVVIAEAYGKIGNLEKMEIVLAAAHKEAERINWPFMHILKKVEISLRGGGDGVPDMLAAWAQPHAKRDVIGSVQFPLPLSQRDEACASCHFGGVLRKDLPYLEGSSL